MEGLVGIVRRNFMMPLPVAESFDAFNARLLDACTKRCQAILRGHIVSIVERMQADFARTVTRQRLTFWMVALPCSAFWLCRGSHRCSIEGIPQTVSLAVKNMTCAHCPVTVRKALEKVTGVADAKVDFDRKTAVVTFDADKADAATLIKAATEAGYPSSLKQ